MSASSLDPSDLIPIGIDGVNIGDETLADITLIPALLISHRGGAIVPHGDDAGDVGPTISGRIPAVTPLDDDCAFMGCGVWKFSGPFTGEVEASVG